MMWSCLQRQWPARGKARAGFLGGAVALLALTACLKLVAVSSSPPFLETFAPVFPELTWRALLLMAATLEVVVCTVVIWTRRSDACLWALLWLACVFGVYRILLLRTGYDGPCHCLGQLPAWMPYANRIENQAALLILVYLAAGSGVFLLGGRARIISVHAPRWLLALLLLSPPPCHGEPEGLKLEGQCIAFAEHLGIERQVQAVHFEATLLEPDWQLRLIYPQTAAVSVNAVVAGTAYCTGAATTPGAEVAGAVLAHPVDLLDSMTEAGRTIFYGCLFTVSIAQTLDGERSIPVPFTPPRYPGSHAFSWELERFAELPGLPRQFTWSLVPSQISQLPKAELTYYFGDTRQGRASLRRFSESQATPAKYLVVQTTNISGLTVPLQSSLEHTYYDEDGRTGRRRFMLSVDRVVPVSRGDLRPALLPGSRVQHVIDGTTYLYSSADGLWLSANEARALGGALERMREEIPRGSPGIGAGRILVVVVLLLFPVALLIHLASRRRFQPPTNHTLLQ